MKKIIIILTVVFFSVIMASAVILSINTDRSGSLEVRRQTVKKNVQDTYEPPNNPYLAQSPWPMSHRNPYNQASSPLAGPSARSKEVHFKFTRTMPAGITLAFGPHYGDGSWPVWISNVRSVCKALLTPDGDVTIIDSVVKENFSLLKLGKHDEGLSGAYTLVDLDNNFYVPGGNHIYQYTDLMMNTPASPIKLNKSFIAETKADEKIIGINMTYNGDIAYVTDKGLCGVVTRQFDKAWYYRFDENERISNSIACDENGGIYVVTSHRMHRVQFTGSVLTIDEKKGGWSARYETGGDISGIRLGEGSGSTPTLMGTGKDDAFVVITDGQKLMHLVLFWRNKIPAQWKQIPGTLDRRIAAQVPVTFGDANTKESLSEQSVCVRGYDTVVVNNQLKISSTSKLYSIMRSGDPSIAPYGIEKFRWDRKRKKIFSVWVNKEISLPNGIPAMSAATGLLYDVGQKNGIWTFEAIDWETGESVFSYPIGSMFWNNSFWAATEIGPGVLFSGASLGFMMLRGK